MDSVVPFKKTPINIVSTGVAYSPINLLRATGGMVYDITAGTKKLDTELDRKILKLKNQVNKGNISEKQFIENRAILQEEYKNKKSDVANTRIDQMAKGLTGSMVSLLGYVLAQSKFIEIKGGNEDEEDEFESKLGFQEYSVRIGDVDISLDWLSPSAIPLFVGANLANNLNFEEDMTKLQYIEAFGNATIQSINPAFETTMLSGLTSSLSSYSSDTTGAVSNMFENAISSYLNQYIPTIVSKLTKTIDPVIRDTKSTKTGLANVVDRFTNQAKSKLPILSTTLPAKQTIWGKNNTRSSSLPDRIVENFINPASTTNILDDKTSNELISVYRNTGDSSVFPKTNSLNKTFTINKEKYNLNNEEYNTINKIYGETSKQLLDILVNSSNYTSLADDEKVELINTIYSYAKEKGKVDYATNNSIDYNSENEVYNTLAELGKNNYSDYINYLTGTIGIISSDEKLNYLQSMNISDKSKKIIYENDISKGKIISNYEDSIYDTLKILTNDDVSIDYLTYKTKSKTGEFNSEKDLEGKTIVSKKEKITNFVINSNMSDIEKMILLVNNNYKLDDSLKDEFKEQLKNSNLSAEEIEKWLDKLK